MRIEEIIKSLDSHANMFENMRRHQAPSDGVFFADILREAIALLKTHPESQPNEPLTLEELRKMDGQPVWLNVAGGVWALVGVADGVFWMDLGGSIDMDHLAGKAYRRPPKEAQ